MFLPLPSVVIFILGRPAKQFKVKSSARNCESHVRRNNNGNCLRSMRGIDEASVGNIQRRGNFSQLAAQQKKIIF